MSTDTAHMQERLGASSEARKFLFDLAFDVADARAADVDEKSKPAFTQEQLDVAKKEAYEAGVAAGKKSREDETARQTNLLLAAIDKKLDAVLAGSQDKWAKHLAQVRSLAYSAMRKVLPATAARNGLEEIEEIVRKAIVEMAREPRLVVRVAEAHFDEIAQRIDALSAKQAYVGKVVVLGEPGFGPSDCLVEWADGGIERDERRIWQEIEGLMAPSFAKETQKDSATGDKAPALDEGGAP